MKKNIVFLCALLFFVGYLFTAAKIPVGGIHGTVSPADAVVKIWAVNGKDSVTANLSLGNFTIEAKPGNWKLYVSALKGYKNSTVDNITVDADRYTNVGEIKLAAE